MVSIGKHSNGNYSIEFNLILPVYCFVISVWEKKG